METLIWLTIIIIGMFGFISLTRKNDYDSECGNYIEKYTKEEREYRKKVVKYIQENISALLWHAVDEKPAKENEKVQLSSLPKNTMFIESGEIDIEYRVHVVDHSHCILFHILDQCVMAVTEDQYIYILSDEYQNFRKNDYAHKGTRYSLGKTNLYKLLQYDIPTIALVYIEHFIRNCIEEKERYYTNYQNYKENEQIKKQTNDKQEQFEQWEKKATNYFINKYKDEYGIDDSTDSSFSEDENQLQNG